EPRQEQADDRIDDADEDHVRAVCAEIVEALRQGIAEIGDGDAAHIGRRCRATHAATCRANRRCGEPDLIVAPFDGIANLHACPPEPLAQEAATAHGGSPIEAIGHETAATSQDEKAYADRGLSSAQIAERPRIPPPAPRPGFKMPPRGA